MCDSINIRWKFVDTNITPKDGIKRLAWSVKLKFFTTGWPWRSGCAHKKWVMLAVSSMACAIEVKFWQCYCVVGLVVLVC